MTDDMETEKEQQYPVDEKRRKKRKTKLPTQTDASVNLEEHWFNANELFTANISIFTNAEIESEERTRILDTLKNTLNLIDDSMKTMNSVTSIFEELIRSLTEFLNHEHIDKKIHFDIVRILINLSDKGLVKLESKSYVTVVCFLLQNCSTQHSEKTMVPFIKKLRKLTALLQNDAFKLACLLEKTKIIASLKTALTQIHFVVSDMGMNIISSIVSIDEELVKEFHECIKRELLSCKKQDAVRIGKIYFHIWENMTEDDRQYFEERYIQWLMDRAFTMGRRGVAVRNLSLNLQGLLSGLHQSRKQAKFSKVITTLYTPLIWKYLSSDNNIHRSNAAEIFMDVYPLEKPGEGMKNYSKYLRKQHDEILMLLNDSCPFVRIIAIKGACANMQYFWVTFQNGSAQKIIEKFVTELIMDGSYSDVRKAVYQGLTQLLRCSEAHDLLKGVLPSLGGFIHDENQSVRQAFIGMLIKIKELKCDIKYWHVVDIYNFAVRLANDTSKNRQLIVHLIFSSFFNEKISLDESYKRLCKFISINPSASRYLAMYSNNELKFEKAVDLMCLIFAKLRKCLIKTMQPTSDENTEPVDRTQRQKVSQYDQNILMSIENIDDCDKENSAINHRNISIATSDSELNRSMSIYEPRISHGLLDFIAMLWLIHGKTLQKEENGDFLEKLYNHAEKCLPIILRYFKETHAFFGALNLAGMIPVSRLAPVTTIVGSCISMLRKITLNSPSNENHCIIHALCSWNRGGDIIELTTEWLNETLRSEALNESVAYPKTRRGKRVQFSRGEAKPVLALRILDDLFSSPTDQKYIFSKNVDDLQSLLKLLSRIKILIERRVEKKAPISEMLSDDFLVNCLLMYGNMIIMFEENKVANFCFWKKFTEYLTWCDRIFVQGCEGASSIDEQSAYTILFELMQIPLTQCVNLIALGKCTNEQLINVLKFNLAILDSEYGIHFVEMSLHLVKQLILFSRIHHTKDRHNEVMVVWFPDMLEKLFGLLTDKIYSKETLSRYIKNLADLKKNLIYVLILSLKLYPELTHASPSYKIMHSFCRSLINVVLFPITECETLNVDQNVKNLPFTGSMMAAIFMSQVELASALLFVLKTIIDRFTEKDGLMLLATASLLYTFAFSQSKIPKSEVLKVVKITYQKLKSIPAEEGCLAVVMNHEQTINDRTIIDVEDTTESAVKEIGQHILKKIAEELGGSLS